MSDLVYAMAEKCARLSGYSTPNESDYRAVAKALAASAYGLGTLEFLRRRNPSRPGVRLSCPRIMQ